MQELLAKLISFRTTADRPEEVKKGFEYIASLFDPEKFDVQTFEKNGKYSLLVSLKGKDALKPKVLLNGHFDVVPAESEDQFEMKIEGNKAYGRGTVDMKGMVAAFIEVMRELGKQRELPDVALLVNGDEEIGGENGAGYMVKEIGMRPQFVLCGDGSYEEKFQITAKAKGGVWLELKAEGKAAHGAYVWKGENAIDKLIEALQKVKKYIGPVEPEAWKTTMNVGVIETSNKTPNKVSSDARAVLDIRFTEELARSPEELTQKIKALVPEVNVSAVVSIAPSFVRKDNDFLQQFKKTAEKVLGQEAEIWYGHGTTDARYFAGAGATAIVFGAQGENMHAAGEWVDLESLEKNKEILLKFLSGKNL